MTVITIQNNKVAVDPTQFATNGIIVKSPHKQGRLINRK